MQTSPLSPRLRLICGAIALSLAGIGSWFWIQGRDTRTTDDAFVDSDIITVMSEAQGTITSLLVTDNAHVKRGAPILTIDAEDLKLALDAAQASKDAADAQLDEMKAPAPLRLSDANLPRPPSGWLISEWLRRNWRSAGQR